MAAAAGDAAATRPNPPTRRNQQLTEGDPGGTTGDETARPAGVFLFSGNGETDPAGCPVCTEPPVLPSGGTNKAHCPPGGCSSDRLLAPPMGQFHPSGGPPKTVESRQMALERAGPGTRRICRMRLGGIGADHRIAALAWHELVPAGHAPSRGPRPFCGTPGTPFPSATVP